MCSPGQQSGVAGLLTAVTEALSALAAADMTALTSGEQADALRVLARAESQALAARSSVLAAFDTSRGYEDDATGGSRSWLRWQTHATPAAAAGAVGWMRRLRAHPRVAAALASGSVSPSWARQVCDWTEPLGAGADAADEILLAAAGAGCELSDLAGLAAEIRARTAVPDTDPDGDGFRDRSLRLSSYWQGNGQLAGDLTPDCAAALRSVLDALGTKAGPEDVRSQDQRDHDALYEALQRLIAARCLPERGGQPTSIQLHMTLDQLLGADGAAAEVAHWAGYGSAPAPPGADCDATLIPVVTGHLDPALLDQLATTLLPATNAASGELRDSESLATAVGQGTWAAAMTATLDPGVAARELILTRATRLLAGPHGLAAWLRTRLTTGPAATISQPLDIGIPTEVIPPHLRRAVVLRDQHCAFPGCDRPPPGCHVHHITPRSEGGVTSLVNCVLLCPFHHLIAIHRWGWQLRLNSDSTKTATSPDGSRALHSHSPPNAA